ncbi:hypothetical protein B9479_006122 [Cryptococcus floricola]|uniref:Anaphase-promoting complex subunit 4 n=1 Tax=Cryptococcus floricola TaxID=2591691 RepID=A0A5D3ARA8_9TREE|nr:hypothetical protein B9479_006122 [Cryptococcus floricola]
MSFPSSGSFTPLSKFALTAPLFLHPQACNPTMDLLVLLSPYPAPPLPGQTPHPMAHWAMRGGAAGGKGKDKDEGKTRVGLWRTGGDKVWEVDVSGRVGGMAWMEDGRFLSLLLVSSGGKTIDTLSVHTGQAARSVPIELDLPVLEDGQWIELEYTDSGIEWEKPYNGSAVMIIDSLPRVTPVEPPKPVNVLPFMRQKEIAPTKQALHPHLSTFPALLPSIPPATSSILNIHSPSISLSFLTGTFPLPPSPPSREVLEIAQVSDRIVGLLDTVLRGVEGMELAFREGEKLTMIHREELETCAKQQGTSISDVHADLFRFLLTGRAGVAVSEWLGSRMTPRTITKWDTTMDTSFQTIQKLVSESVFPSLERILLLLEEIQGWSLTPRYQEHLDLGDTAAIERSMYLVSGLAKLVDGIRFSAKHEQLAAADFMKWLRYESTRSNQDRSTEEPPYATHDLKLVWSFLQNGFTQSPLRAHFPDLLERPPKDLLDEAFVQGLARKKGRRGLNEVMDETMRVLTRPRGQPASRQDSHADSSIAQSMSISMAIDDPPSLDISQDQDISFASSSSHSTIADHTKQQEDPYAIQEVVRTMEKEVWVWSNSVVQECRALVTAAVGAASGEVKDRGMSRWEGLKDQRAVAQGNWLALVPPSMDQLWIIYDSADPLEARIGAFNLAPSSSPVSCLALQFFDDEELVLLLDDQSEDQKHLVTVRYSDLDGMNSIPAGLEDWDVSRLVQIGQREMGTLPPLPIARSRPIESRVPLVTLDPTATYPPISIALNGRAGRRLGCLLVDAEEGKAVEVLDLDADEDEEDEEDGEGDRTMDEGEGMEEEEL